MNRIIEKFAVDGRLVSCAPHGNGHINRTYKFNTTSGKLYILQKINNSIFQDVPALMANITAVTDHLRGKGLSSRQVLTPVRTLSGESFLYFENGDENAPDGYYRVYEFITDAICLDSAETIEDFRQSAIGIGRFQSQLSDFDASRLSETIPRFHDTVNRFALLHEAINADAKNRAKDVRREIEFALAREQEAGSMLKLCREGKLPLRVTHNDTKLNNVMLDAATRTALCVIDLDTVMPGLAGNDFGDSIRFGASTGAEDETDLNKITMSLDLYRAYAEGFLSECGACFTQTEIDTLPMGAKLMTLECGIRFLTDYLQGDTYFRIHRPDHNLDRTRTQFKLIADMESKWAAMNDIVQTVAAEVRK